MNKEDRYIGTNSGRIFHPFAPRVEEVYMPDVVHSLSNIRRWNGHTDSNYVVGQHCIETYKFVKDAGGSILSQFKGLMHDTAEAYSVDLPSPIKLGLPGFVEMEDGIWAAIMKAHNMDVQMPPIVKAGDKWQLMRESVHLFSQESVWLKEQDPLQVERARKQSFPKVMDYHEVYAEFWKIYNVLYATLVHAPVSD